MGNTPIFNFPYPEPTDLVRDGAQNFEDLADAVETTISTLPPPNIQVGPFTSPKSTSNAGRRYVMPGWASFQTVNSSTNNTNLIYFVPIFLSQDTTFVTISFQATNATAATFRLGMYSADPDSGLPLTVEADHGTVATSSSGAKEITTTIPITAGTHYLAMGGSGATTVQAIDLQASWSSPFSGIATVTGSMSFVGYITSGTHPTDITTGFTNKTKSEIIPIAQNLIPHIKLKISEAA